MSRPTHDTRRSADSARAAPASASALLLATLAFAAPALPADAEEPAPPGEGEALERQLDDMKRSLDQFWGDVMKSMEPTIERLTRTFEALERIDDLNNYEDPEVLENGDIIMRRKEEAPPLPPPGVDPTEGVDL